MSDVMKRLLQALSKKDEEICECPDEDGYDENAAVFACDNGVQIDGNFKNDAWDDCGDCSDEPACLGECLSYTPNENDPFDIWTDECWEYSGSGSGESGEDLGAGKRSPGPYQAKRNGSGPKHNHQVRVLLKELTMAKKRGLF